MALTKIDDRGLKTPIDLLDNEKIRFGTGNDLELYHDGTNSYIDNNSGALYLRNNVSSDLNGDIYIQPKSGENSVVCYDDGPVELFYDNTRVFETDSGSVKLRDSIKAKFGTGDDLEIYHNGSSSYLTNSTGNLILESDSYIWLGSKTSSETYIKGIKDGAVELYYDNTKRLATDSQSINILGDEGESCHVYIYADEGDDGADCWRLKADHTASSFYLQNYAGGDWNDTNIKANGGGAVELYYDNFKSFETHGKGITVQGPEGDDADILLNADEGDDNSDKWRIRANTTGDLLIQNYGGGAWDENIKCVASGGVHLYHDDTWKLKVESNGTHLSDSLHIPDSEVAAFGDGDDLKIYHDGTNNYIRSNGAKDIYINPKDTDVGVKVIADGAVELYHDNSKKLETASWGTAFTGNVSPAADNVSDLGATGARWVDAYLGGGLFIGGTGSANKLEDYEEGTYTPVVYYDATNDHTYTEQLGTYTKIGNFVWGTIVLTWNEQNSTGQVGFSLPFTSSNVNGTRTGGYFHYQDGMDIPTSGSPHLILYGSQNSANIYAYFVGGTDDSEMGPGSTYLNNTHTSSNNTVRMVFHYRTA